MIKQDLDHSVIISQYWMKDYRSYADPTSKASVVSVPAQRCRSQEFMKSHGYRMSCYRCKLKCAVCASSKNSAELSRAFDFKQEA